MKRAWKTGILLALAVCAATACTAGYASYDGYGSYSVSASYSSPSLAYVGPDVWAVEGWSEPVFYSDGYYWAYRNNVWYRSPYWDRDWVYVNPHYVPRTIVRIDRPYAYRHYYARPGYRVRYGPSGRVYVRDHRDYDRARRRYYDYRTRRYYDRDRSRGSYYDRRHDNRRYDNNRGYDGYRRYDGNRRYNDNRRYDESRRYNDDRRYHDRGRSDRGYSDRRYEHRDNRRSDEHRDDHRNRRRHEKD